MQKCEEKRKWKVLAERQQRLVCSSWREHNVLHNQYLTYNTFVGLCYVLVAVYMDVSIIEQGGHKPKIVSASQISQTIRECRRTKRTKKKKNHRTKWEKKKRIIANDFYSVKWVFVLLERDSTLLEVIGYIVCVFSHNV